MKEEIVNKVAKSGLITINLSSFLPNEKIKEIDLSCFLSNGVLKELLTLKGYVKTFG